MYVDAVTETYAVSSISQRLPVNGRTIPELFQAIRKTLEVA